MNITYLPAIYDAIQWLLAGNVSEYFAKYISLLKGQRVLDACCGTGLAADMIGTNYFGFDINFRYLKMNAKKYDRKKIFFQMDATAWSIYPASFDSAVMVCAAHHFPDEALHNLFSNIIQSISGRFVFIDIVTVTNPFVKILHRLDVGKYIRSVEENLSLLRSHFELAAHEVFFADRRLYKYLYVDCRR